MRVSTQMMSRMLSDNIQESQSAVYRKEQQIASEKQIRKASDDPAAWGRIARLHGRQEELGQYAENAQLAESRLLATDQALSAIGELLQNASELAVQASDGTLNAGDREVLAIQMDELLEQLMVQANGRYGDNRLFGGVQSGEDPFEVVRNAEGKIESVSYVGSSLSAMVEIAPGDAVPLQLIGGSADGGLLVSGSDNVFESLVEMRDRLSAGENLSGSGLQQEIDTAVERVVVGRVSVGAYLEHLSFVEEIRGNQETMLADGISEEEGVDLALAVSELSEKQTAYQAALAMATQAAKLSLLDYM